jgi:hypothetical protein
VKEWDDSIVDFEAPIDGYLTRSFGGRSGPLTVENGAAVSFPWQSQQEVPGTAPGTIYSVDGVESTGFVALELSSPTMVAGAESAFISMRGFDDGGSQIYFRGGTVGNSFVVSDDGAYMVAAGGQIFVVPTGTTVGSYDGDVTIQSTATGGSVLIDAADTVVITTNATTGTDITIQANAAIILNADTDIDLNTTSGDVFINGVDVSTPLGVWPTFTSGLIQSGAPTFTATYCRYCKQGRMVTVSMFLAITATGSAVAGNAVQITLPFTATQGGNLTVGTGHIYDADLGGSYPARVVLNSTTTARLQPTNVTTGNYLGVAQFTAALAASDSVDMTFTYEATT